MIDLNRTFCPGQARHLLAFRVVVGVLVLLISLACGTSDDPESDVMPVDGDGVADGPDEVAPTDTLDEMGNPLECPESLDEVIIDRCEPLNLVCNYTFGCQGAEVEMECKCEVFGWDCDSECPDLVPDMSED